MKHEDVKTPEDRCQHCRWYEQCKAMTILDTFGLCDDFDPMDDSIAEREYEQDLKERGDEYFDIIKKYNDFIFNCHNNKD